MGKDRLQVRALIGSAPLQVAPARLQFDFKGRFVALSGSEPIVFADEKPLNVVGRERFARMYDARRERLESRDGAARRLKFPGHRKAGPATANRNAENRGHLSDVVVERAAQIGEHRAADVR